MGSLIKIIIFVVLGVVTAQLFGIHNVQDNSWYIAVIGVLLAIGLYAATYGIDIKEAQKHWRMIISAITIGVFAKALIIGGTLALIFNDPFFFLLGIVVAQIDPLSVAAIMDNSRLSKRAKTILAAWSSFDDPITVIMSLYAPLIIAQIFGGHWPQVGDSVGTNGLAGYLGELVLNAGYAAGVFGLWLILRRYAKTILASLTTIASIEVYILLGLALPIAALNFWMLSVAFIGLFLRPSIEEFINKLVKWALWSAAILLGVLLIDGINLWAGILLGAAAFASQIIVGFVLTRGLPRRDRIHLAFAQQNGITAIILALLLEPAYPGTVAIVAPAILTINSIHAVANKIIEKKLK